MNLGITAAEYVAGILSGYLALLAEATHNLSDVVSLILAWFGGKGAELPATKRSTFGYKRIEVMTAFISTAALVVIAVYILFEAYERLQAPQPLTRPWLFIGVATFGLIGNLISVWLLYSEKGVHDLHIWSLSSNEAALSCHICLDERDYSDGPNVIREVNSVLCERFHIGHATIQLERERCAGGTESCCRSPHHWN